MGAALTWTKLGAEWPDEARHLSSDAYRLHVDALCYSNRLLTDLIINKVEVKRFSWVADPDAASRELVAGGWWEDRGVRWYLGAKFAGWQRSREQVEAKRTTDTRAQRRKRLHDSGDHSECLSNCPSLHDTPSAHDTAPDNAHESSSFSERNGTAVKGTGATPTETGNPWDDHPVAVPGVPSSSRLGRDDQDWSDEIYAREQ